MSVGFTSMKAHNVTQASRAETELVVARFFEEEED